MQVSLSLSLLSAELWLRGVHSCLSTSSTVCRLVTESHPKLRLWLYRWPLTHEIQIKWEAQTQAENITQAPPAHCPRRHIRRCCPISSTSLSGQKRPPDQDGLLWGSVRLNGWIINDLKYKKSCYVVGQRSNNFFVPLLLQGKVLWLKKERPSL